MKLFNRGRKGSQKNAVGTAANDGAKTLAPDVKTDAQPPVATGRTLHKVTSLYICRTENGLRTLERAFERLTEKLREHSEILGGKVEIGLIGETGQRAIRHTTYHSTQQSARALALSEAVAGLALIELLAEPITPSLEEATEEEFRAVAAEAKQQRESEIPAGIRELADELRARGAQVDIIRL